MQIEYIDLHFGLKTIGIIEAISCRFFAMCTYTFLKTKTNPRYELGMYLISQHALDCEMVGAKARWHI